MSPSDEPAGRVRPCPGLLAVDRGVVRWHPAATWLPMPAIAEWKGQRHLVRADRLTPRVRSELALSLPEDRLPASRRVDSAMARSTRLVVIPDELRDALAAREVPVWTVGFHRVPSLLRLAGPTGWLETVALGAASDPDALDRVVRAASGGVLDEPSVLLADQLARDRWGNLHEPYEARRAQFDLAREIDQDPELAAELGYEVLRWAPDAQRRWADDVDADRTPDLERSVAALARGGPDEVEVDGVGVFRRVGLPGVELDPVAGEGWLPPLVPVGAPIRAVRLEPAHRYALWER